MITLCMGSFFSGLSGSPHCLGMCGGFASLAAKHPIGYHFGRLFTYSLLGAFAGGFGSFIPGPPWVAGVVSLAMLLWFSVRLAGFAPLGHLAHLNIAYRLAPVWQTRSGGLSVVLMGATTALLPCGLVWSASGLAVAAATPWDGAAVMFSFGIGTIPLLTGLAGGVHKLQAKGRNTRFALAGVVFLVGLWSITARTWNMSVETTDSSASQAEVPSCH